MDRRFVLVPGKPVELVNYHIFLWTVLVVAFAEIVVKTRIYLIDKILQSVFFRNFRLAFSPKKH